MANQIRDLPMGNDRVIDGRPGSKLQRRAALKYGALAAAGAFLAGCNLGTATTPGSTIQEAVADIEAIGAAFPTVSAVLTTLGAAVPSAAVTAVNLIEADAAKVGAAVDPTQTSLVQAILGELPVVATLLTPLGLPAATMSVIDAAVSLAPGIAAAFGITGAVARAPKYSHDAARKILEDARVAARHFGKARTPHF